MSEKEMMDYYVLRKYIYRQVFKVSIFDPISQFPEYLIDILKKN